MTLELLSELLPVILSSAGLTGGIVSAAFSLLIRKARADAERKREERMRLEILRLEGEEKLSELIFALIRYARTGNGERELELAEHAYYEYLEAAKSLKNRIIGSYTFD